jgi:Phage tail tube protein
MVFASGARGSLAYIQEVTFGTTPGSPQLKYFRAVGDKDITPQRQPVETEEVRPDRMTSAPVSGFNNVTGSVGLYLARGDIEDPLKWLMGGAWTADVTAAPQHVLDVGTTLYSFTVEQRFEDITKYGVSRGCVADQMDINFVPGNRPIGGTMRVLGTTAADFSGTSLDATPTAVGTATPLNQYNGSVLFNGVAVPGVTGLTISLANGNEQQAVYGSHDAAAIAHGDMTITGDFTVLFEDDDPTYTRFFTDLPTGLIVRATEPGAPTNWIEFELPAIRLNSVSKAVPRRGFVTFSYNWQADPGSVTAPVATTSLRVRTSYDAIP